MPANYIRRGRVRSVHVSRAHVPRWIDQFPEIQGSLPEKMVMAELVRRGIWFEHTPQTNPLPPPVDRTWEPDFLVPQFKIWIEVQGAYWHSKQASLESDSWRFACIAAVGWRPIFWWDYDILTRLPDLVNEVPEFYFVSSAPNRGHKTNYNLPFWEGGYSIDHLAGLRKALSNRGKPPALRWRRRSKRRAK